jgi:hypothetical protein
VAVLSFEVTFDTVSLLPGNVPLVTSPGIKLEMTRLETESYLLGTFQITPGTYSGVRATVSKLEMTIQNNSGGPLQGCANTAICKFEATMLSRTFEFSGSPFPVTLAAGTPIGLLFDFDLAQSILSDLTVNARLSGRQMERRADNQFDEMEDITGRVANKTASSFDLVRSNGDRLNNIQVNANTEFEDFTEDAGLPNSFASVQNDEIVEIDIRLLAGGALIAKKVELEEQNQQDRELKGKVVALGPAADQFTFVITEEEPDVPQVAVGDAVTVTLQPGARFRIDNEGDVIPAGLVFGSTADLQVGQLVQIRPRTFSPGPTVTTDRIRLRSTRLTATVTAVNGPTLTLNNLPALFTSANPAITEIQARVVAGETEFEGGQSVTLAAGDRVSLRGPLFKGAPPVMLVKKVRKR